MTDPAIAKTVSIRVIPIPASPIPDRRAVRPAVAPPSPPGPGRPSPAPRLDPTATARSARAVAVGSSLGAGDGRPGPGGDGGATAGRTARRSGIGDAGIGMTRILTVLAIAGSVMSYTRGQAGSACRISQTQEDGTLHSTSFDCIR